VIPTITLSLVLVDLLTLIDNAFFYLITNLEASTNPFNAL
jgi:hypothetical protein